MIESETQRWAWLLFESGLAPRRAKQLLQQWQQAGWTVTQAIARLPRDAAALGLTPTEARRLAAVPSSLPQVTALRWDEPHYPSPLRDLPLHLRPALLFYRGKAELLQRPLVHISSAFVHRDGRELMSLLLGEAWLPSAVYGTPPATLLLEEMAATEGEALLWVAQGLPTISPDAHHLRYLDEGRLLLVTPFPPRVAANPNWLPPLKRIARTTADFCLVTDVDDLPHPPRTRILLLTDAPPAAPLPSHVHLVHDPAELPLYLLSTEGPPSPAPTPHIAEKTTPTTPDDVLALLERSGRVPQVLRDRLRRMTS